MVMALEHEIDSALAHAIRHIGGQTALARLLDTRQSTVRSWLERGQPLPAEYVLRVEAELRRRGIAISRHDLRPDIYPLELEQPQSSSIRGGEAPAVVRHAAGVPFPAEPSGSAWK